MKKNLILLLLSLLSMSQLSAQDYEYIPFVREGVKWVCFYDNTKGSYADRFQPDYNPFPELQNYFTLELKGDLTIGEHVYKALHKYSGPEIDEANDTIIIYLREEDKVVYGIRPGGGYWYNEFPVGYGPVSGGGGNYNAVINGNEFILYDFNDPATRYVFSNCHPAFSYLGTDAVQVGDKMARRHRFHQEYDSYIIEGVGYDGYAANGYTLQYFCTSPYCNYFDGYSLSHVIENGEIIYKGINYEGVMPYSGWMPMTVGAKTWVNERVIVNKGDTTRYYYSYHIPNHEYCYPIKNNGVPYFGGCYTPVYYSEVSHQESEGDSVIAYLCEEQRGVYFTSCYNRPLDEVISQNRNLIRDDHGYEGLHYQYYIYHGNPTNTIRSYLQIQTEPKTLTTDNFVVVDPIKIGDYECERCAILDEDGEVLAYLVEGIGFDSRDMGDLLTPFTRRPDPDAEYQEWCGLSHVIKDGEIIYKGLCYDEKRVQEAMALGEPGDLNGDGVVSITDVTLLIELVLNGPATGGPHRADGDMNGNGDINITDVVMLIEQVLQQ